MKKFLFRLFIFVVLIFGIGILMWIKNGNTIYTNAYLSEKLKFLEQNPHFNTVFIGSSKVNNQINPEIIDQINPKLKSYNLGANASFNLENFETIDYLLESEKVNLRYLILELQNKVDFTKSNLHSERSFSALTPQNLWFDLKYQWQEKDVKQIAYTLYSSVLNIYYFKKEQGELKDFDLQKTIKKNGFIPLDQDQNRAVKKRNIDLQKNPKEIERRLNIFEIDRKKYRINEALVEKLEEIRQRCAEKNIQLVLLISAPAEPEAKELLVYKNLKNIPVINMMMPNEYPEFYLLENRWDYGHLNEKGANIFSEKVGQKLKTILK